MSALTIYQEMLDKVTKAVMTNDLHSYLSCICLPYVVRTHRAVFTFHTEAELHQVFGSVHDSLMARGVTDYVRIARSATFQSRQHIEGFHYTHMLRDGERIAAPHSASQSLIRSRTRWQFTEARYAVENSTLPLTLPELGPRSDTPPRLVIHETGTAM